MRTDGRPEPIRPGIVLASGETIYPTGDEWLLAFALRGCEWAIDALGRRRDDWLSRGLSDT